MLMPFFLSVLAAAATVPQIPHAYPLPPPPQKAPVLYAPPGTSGTGVYTLTVGTLDADTLIENFKNQLWLQDAETRKYDSKSALSRKMFDTTYDFPSRLMRLNFAHQWAFTDNRSSWTYEAPAIQGNWPTRAVQIVDKSTPNGYDVEVIIHCYELADSCMQYIAGKKQLPAPRLTTLGLGLSYAQWKNRVAAEPCQKLPASMNHPRYPPQALRDGIGGTVRVGFIYNSCGNVRDAWIETSSRNRDLDRAALNEVFKWQIDINAIPEADRIGMAIAPVIFRPE